MEQFIIISENSSDHWPFFNVAGKNVLDLGCGLWDIEDYTESSPIYFGRSARKVVGVDADQEQIQNLTNYTIDNPLYSFSTLFIEDVSDVRDLLQKHSITALKSDIEGGESVLLELTSSDLAAVDTVAIEYHSQELLEQFLNKLPEWGYDIKLHAKFQVAMEYPIGVLYGVKQ